MSMIEQIKRNMSRAADLAEAGGVDQTSVANVRLAVRNERGMSRASDALRHAVARTDNADLYTQVSKLVMD
jgi:hypothetical protein